MGIHPGASSSNNEISSKAPFNFFKKWNIGEEIEKHAFQRGRREDGIAKEAANSVRQTPQNSGNLTFPKRQTQTTTVAVKWAFGRFPPIRSTLLEGKCGEMVHQHVNRTRENLKEYTLSRGKIQATKASLEQLLFLTASFFEDME